MTRAQIALTIGYSDSSGGTGIQADLKTFAALGVYGAAVITAVTARNSRRVSEAVALEPAFVAAQIDTVLGDIGSQAVKTGQLSNDSIIVAVAERMKHFGIDKLVVDPEILARGGGRLLDDEAVTILKQRLLPLAMVVTPNLPEAEILSGLKIESWEDAREAARNIASMGPRNVVITGAQRGEESTATDLLFDGSTFREFSTGRVQTGNTLGTGTTFAAAIAATLAKGDTLANAVAAAKAYVTKALLGAYSLGGGPGPVHHFYRYWQPRGD
jgi:hydroxymethylpyrimidine/phosphomethylpyrimidine kinase